LRKIIKTFCPETGSQQSIEVNFERIALGYGQPSGSKILGYSCSYSQEHGCETKGDDGTECPLYQAARQMNL